MSSRPRALAAALAFALLAALIVFSADRRPSSAYAQEAAPAPAKPGVCRGTDPGCYHDWGNFDPGTDAYRILLYTRTAGPRHANLGPALGTGLNPALATTNVVQNAIVRMGEEHDIRVDWTEDPAQLATASRLFAYNAVVFFSTSRDTLDDAAQTALRQYIRGGGGFVGAHNAFGTEYNWPWYEGLLGEANFYDHGPNQPGKVVMRDGRSWTFTDEWYNLLPAPSRVRVLARVDESSLAEGVRGTMGHPGHGAGHPVAWCQYYDGGRAWLTTLGHDAKAFTTDGSYPGAADFQKLLLNGIESAMGREPFCR
ncbi:ThuA domain-containing protein [Streptomyces sp. A7024]|uniref:ThuA domain-containing protein n=1 Tax=Streptomyces coryli TaxID=1128680 RepID=A0A6G4TRT9_9ACTN|nr:ThuA domain-containing protein [Streptomyces coryli]NGN62705.1 ThuA domain-containing protein [Streptomyces coryli]